MRRGKCQNEIVSEVFHRPRHHLHKITVVIDGACAFSVGPTCEQEQNKERSNQAFIKRCHLRLCRGRLINQWGSWSDGEQGPQTNDKKDCPTGITKPASLLLRQLAVTFIISARCRGEARVKCAQARFDNLVGDVPDDRQEYEGHSSNEEPVAGNVRSEITEDRFDTCFGNTKQQRVKLTRE